MFAKVADLTKFMFCYSIMSANRNALENSASSRPHVRLGSSTNVNQAASGIPPMSEFPLIGRKTLVDTDLDQFFPFDPYDLPRSKVYVDKLYRNWDEVSLPGMKGEEDDEDEDDDEEDDSGTDSESSGRSLTPNDASMTNRSDRLRMPSATQEIRAASTRPLSTQAQQIGTSLEGLNLTSPPRHARSLGIVA
jgi:hypothetical protein